MKPRKIKPEQEPEIARLYQEGAIGTEIAKMFNVSQPTIYAVLDRQSVKRRPSRSEFYKSTDEMVDDAEHRYQKGELLSDVAKEHGVSPATLYRRLKARGIEIYPNGYQQRAFMPNQDDEIGKRYAAGENMYQLAAAYDTAPMNIKKAVLRSGRKMRAPKVAHRQYNLNELAFSVLTPESAYWTGFIMADGCLIDKKEKKQSYVLSVDLKKNDRDHLIKLASFLSYAGPLHDSKSRHQSQLVISSDALAADLMRWGVAGRKSLNEKPCDALLVNANYWRGEVDGDGSIWIRKGNKPGEYMPAISLVGGEYLIHKFADFARSITNTNTHPARNKCGMWRFAIYCGPAVDIIRLLYAGCAPEIALTRKMERANRILEQWPHGYDGAADHKLW